ncbi:ATP-dependent helicase [Engelhardtia mirabilis]|uniref:DNA 3'-5' helicase n=1 Tax=Engelhardtia mirabilis TaxID=2528011 RepID=A0A518BG30_9BACT|nr:ATP-dependent DNA helicase PcrA [Planctomycetes bacterium Pla133]QDV00263.1 ATP-dependent DNA helicase PcrA [Planctomycetes bacterium Pla86]
MVDPQLQATLDGLNPQQREAVGTVVGPLLVLAGAGSGKTRVITVRASYLLSQGVDPTSILLVTFTNKAAEEMRERLQVMVGEHRAEALTIGTFHSFCLAVLREHGERIGLPPRFTLCDAADQLSGVKQVLRELRVAETAMQPRTLQGRISLLKNLLIPPARALSSVRDDEEELVARAYAAYEEWLRRSRVLDFDDLLVKTVELMRDHDDMRSLLRDRYQYVMVDEYQDTNEAQYEMLRLLAGPDGNICAVGDDDQAIYGWRGADVRKILGFEQDFRGATLVKLETNYRSTPQVLEAANKVIRNNTTRHEKTLRAHLPDGLPVEGFAAEDDVGEADHICLQIETEVRERRSLYSDFAVLFRTAIQPRAIEAQLRARAIPYVLIGGMSFFDRKEVKDVLAYMRAALNPDDEAALLRILNRPPRGIGKKSIDRTLEFATANGITVGAAFDRADEIEGLPKAAVRAAQALRANLAEWVEPEPEDNLPSRIETLLELVGYRSEVERTYPDELTQTQRWSAVDELVRYARAHVKRRKKPSLGRFLTELALDNGESSKDKHEGRDVVKLMTLHSAKGLEFRTVYLVGLEEGILPHGRSVAEDRVEEERRLAYVGITRARERLVLSYCTKRARAGGYVECHPSRFLFEIKQTPPPASWRAADDSRPAVSAGRGGKGRGGKGRGGKGRGAGGGKGRAAGSRRA